MLSTEQIHFPDPWSLKNYEIIDGIRGERPYLCGRVNQARNRADAVNHLPSFQDLRASSRRGCHRLEFLRPLLTSTRSTVVKTTPYIHPGNAVTQLIIFCTSWNDA